jgi:hypothetical protein
MKRASAAEAETRRRLWQLKVISDSFCEDCLQKLLNEADVC